MEESNPTQFKYHAFISYRHADNKVQGRQWATWLHQAIETYEVPKDLVGQKNGRGDLIPERIYPIFRDEEELPAHADLGTSIVSALEQTNLLVVLCSPRAVASTYVADEIDYFKKIGGSERIIAAMIDGEPNTSWDESKTSLGFSKEDECFPLPLQFEYDQNGNPTKKYAEPIAADFRINNNGKPEQGFTTPAAYREYLKKNSELNNKEIAKKVDSYQQQIHLMLLKIIAGILGVPLGDLTQRDKAYQLEQARLKAKNLRKWLAGLALLTIASVATGIFAYVQKEKAVEQRIAAQTTESRFLATASMDKLKGTDSQGAALQIALQGLPKSEDMESRPVVPLTMFAMTSALLNNRTVQEIPWEHNKFQNVVVSNNNEHLVFEDSGALHRYRLEEGRWLEQSPVLLSKNEDDILRGLPEQDLIMIPCKEGCNYVSRKISSPEIGTEIKLTQAPDSDALLAHSNPSSSLQHVLHPNNILETFDLKTAKSLATVGLSAPLENSFDHDEIKTLYVNNKLNLVAIVNDTSVLVFDLITGEGRFSFGRDANITATSLVKSKLAIGYEDGYLQIVNFETRKYIYRNTILAGKISDIAFDTEANQIMVSSVEGGGLAYLDLLSDSEPQILNGLDDNVTQVAFSPDGSSLMGLDVMGKIRIWQYQNLMGTLDLWPVIDFMLPDARERSGYIKRMTQGRIVGRNVRFGPDNISLIVADNMSIIRIVQIDAPIDSKLSTDLPGGQEIYSSPSGHTIVSLDRENKALSILDNSDLSVLKVVDDLPVSPDLLILSDKADAIFVVMASIGVIERRSTKTGELVATLTGILDAQTQKTNLLIGETVFGHSLRDDATKLAIGTLDGYLFVWDLIQNSLDTMSPVESRSKALTSLSWSPSGEYLMVSSLSNKGPVVVHLSSYISLLDSSEYDALMSDNTLEDEEREEKLYKLSKRREEQAKMSVRPLKEIVKQRFRSAVYLDDKTVLGITERGDIITVNLEGEVLYSKDKAQENIGTMLTLDRSKGLLFSASGMRERSLWLVKNPREPKLIWEGLSSNPRPWVSADGKTFAVLPNPSNIFLLNTETGSFITAYGGHKLQVSGVAFSKNGSTVISSSLNGTLVWDNPKGSPQKWIQRAENNLNRFSPLSRADGCLNHILPESECPEFR